MKLLFDQNLSHRLPERLHARFPDSTHVIRVRLDRASDEQIWDFAKTNGYCIVTQDADFAERSRLFGAPPKVVWLRCGNCTPQEIEAILTNNAGLVVELAEDDVLTYLEIFRT